MAAFQPNAQRVLIADMLDESDADCAIGSPVRNIGYDMPLGGPSVTAKAHGLNFGIRTAPDPRKAAWLILDDRIQLLAVFIEGSPDFAG